MLVKGATDRAKYMLLKCSSIALQFDSWACKVAEWYNFNTPSHRFETSRNFMDVAPESMLCLSMGIRVNQHSRGNTMTDGWPYNCFLVTEMIPSNPYPIKYDEFTMVIQCKTWPFHYLIYPVTECWWCHIVIFLRKSIDVKVIPEIWSSTIHLSERR